MVPPYNTFNLALTCFVILGRRYHCKYDYGPPHTTSYVFLCSLMFFFSHARTHTYTHTHIHAHTHAQPTTHPLSLPSRSSKRPGPSSFSKQNILTAPPTQKQRQQQRERESKFSSHRPVANSVVLERTRSQSQSKRWSLSRSEASSTRARARATTRTSQG